MNPHVQSLLGHLDAYSINARTLLRLFDSREINDVMRRILVSATKINCKANQLTARVGIKAVYHDRWPKIGRSGMSVSR
jgi:hypothetical protein